MNIVEHIERFKELDRKPRPKRRNAVKVADRVKRFKELDQKTDVALWEMSEHAWTSTAKTPEAEAARDGDESISQVEFANRVKRSASYINDLCLTWAYWRNLVRVEERTFWEHVVLAKNPGIADELLADAEQEGVKVNTITRRREEVERTKKQLKEDPGFRAEVLDEEITNTVIDDPVTSARITKAQSKKYAQIEQGARQDVASHQEANPELIHATNYLRSATLLGSALSDMKRAAELLRYESLSPDEKEGILTQLDRLTDIVELTKLLFKGESIEEEWARLTGGVE